MPISPMVANVEESNQHLPPSPIVPIVAVPMVPMAVRGIPNPSFGEEDFGRLVAGIENIGSVDSFGSVSVGDLVGSSGDDDSRKHYHHQHYHHQQRQYQQQQQYHQQQHHQQHYRNPHHTQQDVIVVGHAGARSAQPHSQGGYYASSERVTASSTRYPPTTAEYHPPSPGGNPGGNGVDDSNRTLVHANTTSAAAAAAASAAAASNANNSTSSSSMKNESSSNTPRDNITVSSNDGSLKSILISTPSHSTDGSRDNMAVSHSPNSFLLEDSLLDPRRRSYDLSHSHSFAITPGTTGDNTNHRHHPHHHHQQQQQQHATPTREQHGYSNSPIAYNASPVDWEYANMDHFFNETDMGPSSISTGASDVMRKRKSDVSAMESIDSKDNTVENSKRSRLMYNNSLSSFAQFGVSGPIASFGVFGTLSNNSSIGDLPSTEGPRGSSSSAAEQHQQQQQQQRNNPRDDATDDDNAPTIASERGTTRPSSASSTVVLSPRNRLSSPQRAHSSLDNAPRHQPSSSENIALPPSSSSSSIVITKEHSHPSKGTLEHYDSALYHRLRNTAPPRSAKLPPLLVPRDRRGNRLAIIRGSGRKHSDFEIEECISGKTFLFYKFLREIYPALEGCRYLLPGLQRGGRSGSQSLSEDVLDNAIRVSEFGNVKLGHVPGMTKAQKSKLAKSDLSIAKQRVECAIYAFGGFVTRKQPQRQPQPDKRSIFRTRNESESSSSTTTPSSNNSASQGSGKKKSKQPSSRSKSSVRRERYEKKLRQQYFEHGNRLSWDVQANLSLTLNGAKTFDEYDDNPLKKSGSSMDQSENSIGGSTGRPSSQRRNRCKKCGQIKHGHICPFQSSLQRSIGIMVYPSVNAHVADEPGMLAPALCEMNNFISIKSGSFEVASSDAMSGSGGDGKGRKVMAATVASTIGKLSKEGVPSGGDAAVEMNPFRRKTILATVEAPVAMCTIIDDKRSDEEEGRDHDKVDEKHSAAGGRGGAEDLLFQPQMEITLDQYRAVTPSKDSSSSSSSESDYVYPQVPLTFTQRKSMSDALFSLSKLVPELMDECGMVLTEARKRDQWDLAVAELMTQVICVLHCSPDKDYTLEGLRKYLMGLGIVC